MKVLKYLRSSHSSAAQGDVTDVHKSSGRKAQSAPTSPTPTNKQQQQHPEDTKPSSSFFSRSFRRSKSFTRMRNFFENIANLRGEPKAEPEEGEGKVTLRKKGSTAGERPEDRASVHDDRICEVLHSMLSEQQALFGKSPPLCPTSTVINITFGRDERSNSCQEHEHRILRAGHQLAHLNSPQL